MCLCLGARRVIVVGGSSRDRAVLATYGSRVNCESGFLPYFVFFPVRSFDISAYILLLFLSCFSHFFLSLFFTEFCVQLYFSPCRGRCFSGFDFSPLCYVFQDLSLFPLNCWYAARGALPSFFALAGAVAGRAVELVERCFTSTETVGLLGTHGS